MSVSRRGTMMMVVMPAALSAIAADPPAAREAQEPGPPLRVMTFNVRYGTADDGPNHWDRRKELVIRVLREHRPDVAGLQEALRFQLDAIRESLPDYAELGVGRDDGRERGEYSAILYRSEHLRAEEHGTFWLSDTPEVPGSTSWGNHIPRICTWARFVDRRTGAAFRVYNTHFDHQSQPSRELSAELIARRIRADAGNDPVIVTGDLNAAEDNPAVLFLKGRIQATPARDGDGDSGPPPPRLVDTFRAVNAEATQVGTWHPFDGRTGGDKIDYVLVSEGIEVLEAAILHDHHEDRYPSDHYPVTAVITIPRASAKPDGKPRTRPAP